jgi:hypothetical protein
MCLYSRHIKSNHHDYITGFLYWYLSFATILISTLSLSSYSVLPIHCLLWSAIHPHAVSVHFTMSDSTDPLKSFHILLQLPPRRLARVARPHSFSLPEAPLLLQLHDTGEILIFAISKKQVYIIVIRTIFYRLS